MNVFKNVSHKHLSSLPGAKADPKQYFVSISEQLSKLILDQNIGSKRRRAMMPPGSFLQHTKCYPLGTNLTHAVQPLPPPSGEVK